MPSDPGRLSSTQVSFRVRLAAPVASLIDPPPPAAGPYADAFGRAYASLSYGGRPGLVRAGAADAAPARGGVGAGRRKGRVTAVTWSGQAAPGDLAATQLLDAVRLNTVSGATVGGGSSGARALGSVGLADPETETTQPLETVPGWDSDPVGGGRTRYGGRGGVPRQPAGADRRAVPTRINRPGWRPDGELPQHSASSGEPSRHAWYPGRRVDLGLVLLPLRMLLGSLSVYAGFSKLCDPVYFDGGDRGSMMRWLSSLHPWRSAQPLLDFAMAHPVGAGLGVSFTEVVVGVLTLLGLWQRLAAGAAMLLSAALLFTVSWRAVPVYDTPDLIFLAAWSPLLMAGAPYASLDGRLALEAWRRYGPQAPGAVRRRVLRRGTVVATVVIGLTMLLGSLLGAAVRTSGRTAPVPAPPTDYGTPVWPAVTGAPGSARPAAPAGHSGAPSPSASTGSPTPSPAAQPSHSPKPHASGAAHGESGAGSSSAPAAAPGGAPAGSAAPAPTSGGAGGNRAPKPSPTGGGLLGGVLGSGPPAGGLLPSTLGMPAGGRSTGGPVV
ncbi:DoxX family membrane protein [Kitasatospora viridis]|uniref:DoxX-like protein n=1 Tax=Kitasatospora viridis TaxID=281105 RepID=A0A561UIR9_9ACTN|nr:DoxX family membrane protein [Kitasatospora viridis]TWF99234.1 DoxX-like protein [Kitasatospora viridis]